MEVRRAVASVFDISTNIGDFDAFADRANGEPLPETATKPDMILEWQSSFNNRPPRESLTFAR
jgi:hypothetical protein